MGGQQLPNHPTREIQWIKAIQRAKANLNTINQDATLACFFLAGAQIIDQTDNPTKSIDHNGGSEITVQTTQNMLEHTCC